VYKLIIMSWFSNAISGYAISGLDFSSKASAENAKVELLKAWDGYTKPVILVVPA